MRDFEGNVVKQVYVEAPCGNLAEFDEGSGYAYRCLTCGAVLGSIAMPKECADIVKRNEMWKILKS